MVFWDSTTIRLWVKTAVPQRTSKKPIQSKLQNGEVLTHKTPKTRLDIFCPSPRFLDSLLSVSDPSARLILHLISLAFLWRDGLLGEPFTGGNWSARSQKKTTQRQQIQKTRALGCRRRQSITRKVHQKD